MKTKFSVLVLCLSFLLLIAVSGTISVQKGMCQWPSIDSSYGAQGHYVAGALTNYFNTGSVGGALGNSIGSGSGSIVIGFSAQGHIAAGAMTNYASTGSIVAGALTHRSGSSSTSTPGQNGLYSSWGMRTAEYYFHDFFLNPILGLGNYMNYIGGLQYGAAGFPIGAFGFPTSYDSSKLAPQFPIYHKPEPSSPEPKWYVPPDWDPWVPRYMPDPWIEPSEPIWNPWF